MPVRLPIDEVLPEVCTRLRHANTVVVHAPTGAGKTTRLPAALLDEGLAGDQQVWCLEPRRLAARSSSRHVARQRGGQPGREVGWHVRFEPEFSKETRLLYLTDGIAVRRLQADPWLESVGIVIFDEFHERALATDLALSIVRRVQQELRDDLKIVVMSATLDATRVSRFLDDAPIVRSQGRSFPVDIRYATRPDDRWIETRCADGVRTLLSQTEGDILAFLPGVREIDATAEQLAGLHGVDVLPLHGRLPAGEQDRALRTGPRRRIVLATNVAETSLTLDGITGVVDTGVARILRHDPGSGLDRLQLEPISKASADQRAGRAGRQSPGVALRLWTERSHTARIDMQVPSLQRADLAGALLQLRSWGEPDPRAFPWVEPPPTAAIDAGEGLLAALGLVSDGSLTALGEAAANLPVHPRLGVLLLTCHGHGHGALGAWAAAALSERDPFRRHDRRDPPPPDAPSDVLERALALRDGSSKLRPGVRRHLRTIADRLRSALRKGAGHALRALDPIDDPHEAVRRAVGRAWADRLALRRAPGSPRARMLGGRGVSLAPGSAVHTARLFVCVEVDDAPAREATVRIASAVEEDWLSIETRTRLSWDAERRQVVARRERICGDLILSRQPAPLPAEEQVAACLAQALAAQPDLLPLDEAPLSQLRGRLRALAAHAEDLNVPDASIEGLLARLPDLCRGHRGLASLTAQALHDGLYDSLDWKVRQALDTHAPARLTVPSGSSIRLDWATDGPPVLAVRMQEVFGLAETPRVLRGRVPVLLHLLAPNRRPAQITEDLASFWVNTYPEVRKELRRRYPKHAWPDDPLTAPAERRPRRRRKT